MLTHFERFKVQRQVKLSRALTMHVTFVTCFFCAKPTKKNQHLSSRIYTRCLARSESSYVTTRMVLSSEARQSQQLLMFASSAKLINYDFVHKFTSDLSMSTVIQSLCVARGLYTLITKCSGCSIHFMNLVTNNTCLFLALAA